MRILGTCKLQTGVPFNKFPSLKRIHSFLVVLISKQDNSITTEIRGLFFLSCNIYKNIRSKLSKQTNCFVIIHIRNISCCKIVFMHYMLLHNCRYVICVVARILRLNKICDNDIHVWIHVMSWVTISWFEYLLGWLDFD